MAIRDTRAMIAGMSPVLRPGRFVFCSGADPALASAALGSFREAEGLSLILPEAEARAAGLACDMPMALITLEVPSALDGIGLTAAVATALAAEGIACNIVAAFHHDHVFVLAARAEAALAALRRAASAAAEKPITNP